MKNSLHEKTGKEKIVSVVIRILQIAALLIFAYVLFLQLKTGQHIHTPLIGPIILVIIGIFRIISLRSRFQGSTEDRKKFNKIVIRSVILAPIIVAAFLTIAVFIMLK